MKKQNNENKHLPITNSNRNDSSAANYLSAENIRLPPYLSKGDPLEALGFPVRLENALKFHGITIVGEFFEEPKDKLIKIRNVGHRSLGYFDEVKKRIREHFGALPNNLSVKAEEASAEEPSIPNDQLITNLLERCGTERVKDVVDRRYGLKNGERQTLEEIGEFYKVTRERIRQIQAKALRRMKHPATKARKPLVALAEKLLYDQGGIITDEEADIEVPRAFDGSGEDGSSVFDLLSDLGWIQSCKIGDFKVYSPAFNGISICRLTEDIVSMIEKENIGIEVYTIIEKISRFGKIKDSRFNPKMFIMRYCRIDPRIEESAIGSGLSHQSDDPDLMVSFRPYTANFSGKGWIVLITRVLESEQMPLHFTEITDKVNDLMGNTGRQIDVRRAHSILVDCEIFAHSGIRGTYGLTSWGLRKESTPQLIEECLKKAGFPLHWKQIFNYVSKFKNTKPENIISVLKFNKTFGEQGKGIYWFKKGRA